MELFFTVDVLNVVLFRETPAPIRIEVRGIADTSNFDDFGDCDLTIRELFSTNFVT